MVARELSGLRHDFIIVICVLEQGDTGDGVSATATSVIRELAAVGQLSSHGNIAMARV